jgi:ABC-type transport system involved in multi-copper enzyme maturation permease subunit
MILRGTGTIMQLTFQEAVRRRLVVSVSVMGVVFLVLFAIGFFFVQRNSTFPIVGERPEVMNFFLVTGLYVVNFLVVMLSVLASVDIVAGEISSGTIQTIVMKPIRRWTVILGKWLGLSTMVAIFVVGMSAGMMGIVWAFGSYLPPHPWEGVLLMVMEGVVMLSLSLLGGTRLTTLANGVILFMLYGLAFIAGWIEQIGSFVDNATMTRIGIVISLVIPSEALWRRAAYLMQPEFLRQLGFGPFATALAPSGAMVIYAGVYTLAALGAAMLLFRRRDL